MLKIKQGVIQKPEKLMIYGAEGIGKSTLVSHVPDPLFIDTEGGTAMFDVKRIDPAPKNWTELLDTVNEVADNPGICKSLVLDTADWAEQMCIAHVCEKNHKGGIEDFNYGRGYTYVMEEFSNFIKALDRVIAAGMNVVITAHAKMRKMELPDEQGAFDRWELKLTKQVAPLIKEWVDDLLFLNYKTMVIKTDDTHAKAQGGRRVIYTTHHPCWDAKNRHGLEEELELRYENISGLFGDLPAPIPSATPADRLMEKLREGDITEEELRRVVSEKGHFPYETPISEYPEEFITGWIFKFWPQIIEKIEKYPDRVPF